jgi:hypothetical protein
MDGIGVAARRSKGQRYGHGMSSWRRQRAQVWWSRIWGNEGVSRLRGSDSRHFCPSDPCRRRTLTKANSPPQPPAQPNLVHMHPASSSSPAPWPPPMLPTSSQQTEHNLRPHAHPCLAMPTSTPARPYSNAGTASVATRESIIWPDTSGLVSPTLPVSHDLPSRWSQ